MTHTPSHDAPLMLSVSGLRGIVGRSLTPPVVCRYAAAWGSWLRENTASRPQPPHVVVGRDSRPSGEMFAHAALAGLLATGCRVTNLGVATTPGVAVRVEQLAADGGLVITASHNPIIWNGLKPLRHDGTAPPKDQAQQLIDRFQRDAATYADVSQLQFAHTDNTTPQVHRDLIAAHVDVDAIRAAKLKVVVDSVHGAGGDETRALLEHLGVQLVHLYAEPTGRFPHEPEPLAQNLTELGQQVLQHRADIGFAQDPDADRLAIVDEQGVYIGEEYTLALCALHKLSRGQIAVANLSTSRMIDDIAASAGARVVRTPVGEANVAQAIRQHAAALGGEGNGGIIWPRITHVRDSLVGMALVLEMLAQRRQPLSRIVDQIPRYAIVKDKVPFQSELAGQLAPVLRQQLAAPQVDEQDGVRLDWPDRWVHVRPSNTEPIIRLIAEAHSESDARDLIHQVRQALGLA